MSSQDILDALDEQLRIEARTVRKEMEERRQLTIRSLEERSHDTKGTSTTARQQLQATQDLLHTLIRDDEAECNRQQKEKEIVNTVANAQHFVRCFSGVAAARDPLRPFPAVGSRDIDGVGTMMPPHGPVSSSWMRYNARDGVPLVDPKSLADASTPYHLRLRTTLEEVLTDRVKEAMRSVEAIYNQYTRLMADTAMHAVRDVGRLRGEQHAARYMRAQGLSYLPTPYEALTKGINVCPPSFRTRPSTAPQKGPSPPTEKSTPRTTTRPITSTATMSKLYTQAQGWYDGMAATYENEDRELFMREQANARISRVVSGPIDAIRQLRAEQQERQRMRKMEAMREDQRIEDKIKRIKQRDEIGGGERTTGLSDVCCCTRLMMSDAAYIAGLSIQAEYAHQLSN